MGRLLSVSEPVSLPANEDFSSDSGFQLYRRGEVTAEKRLLGPVAMATVPIRREWRRGLGMQIRPFLGLL